jgi:hypothetical protein
MHPIICVLVFGIDSVRKHALDTIKFGLKGDMQKRVDEVVRKESGED